MVLILKTMYHTLDQMTRCWMTRSRQMIVFFNMIDISALNAKIIWLKWQNTIPEKNTVGCNLIIELAKTIAAVLPVESLLTASAQSSSASQVGDWKRKLCYTYSYNKDKKCLSMNSIKTFAMSIVSWFDKTARLKSSRFNIFCLYNKLSIWFFVLNALIEVCITFRLAIFYLLAISNKNVMNKSLFYTYELLILLLLNKILFQIFVA